MAYDIYGQTRNLQQGVKSAEQRMADADQAFAADARSKMAPNPAMSMLSGSPIDKVKQQSYNTAKGKRDAEYNAAFVDADRQREQLKKEEERTNAIKPFAELQEKQEMRAKEFRTAFPSILDSKLGTERTNMRRQIAEGVGNVRAGYNQRGLLFSGMRSGAEADVGNEAENKLADIGVQTKQELMDQGNQLDQDAIDTGLTMGNISKDLASTNEEYRKSIIDMLLQKDQQRQQALGGLLGTGAQIAGLGLGAAIK